MTTKPTEEYQAAFAAGDAGRVREVLRRASELVDLPLHAFDSPAVVAVRTREMLDVLLEAGADINARSHWWAGGFGLLDQASPELASYAIKRGARIDAHAAARLDLTPTLRSLLEADPAVVHTRGGDGKTPLHCARTVEVADLLLEYGAEIDARDIDHESTPLQYAVRDCPELARHLVELGCKTDLLAAAALGDEALVSRHLESDPDCLRLRVDEAHFPKSNPRAGGTIYQWTLGFYVGVLQVAREFGHRRVLDLLLAQSPPELLLLDACECQDEARAGDLLKRRADLIGRLRPEEVSQIAHAARNNHAEPVRLMLDSGWPVDARGQHGATPLHWAAYHGNKHLIETLLTYGAPLDAMDADFNGTLLSWLEHGSKHSWHRGTGDYSPSVQALLAPSSGLRFAELAYESSQRLLR